MRAWLFLALVILGCAPARAFEVDPKFSADERSEIARAAEEWNARTKPARRITFDGHAWRVLKEDPATGFNGRADSSTRTIQIRPEHPGVSTYAIALHEFGHAVGLGHTDSGVMMAFTVSTEFTPDVIAECRRVGACP